MSSSIGRDLTGAQNLSKKHQALMVRTAVPEQLKKNVLVNKWVCGQKLKQFADLSLNPFFNFKFTIIK